jgi:lantibiotic biosynthesis protein
MNAPPGSEPVPGWNQNLYAGAPGIALAHIEYAHAGLGSQHTAHRWTAITVRAPVTADPRCGLHWGAPAVAFALHASGQPGCGHALAVLDEHIAAATRRRLRRARERIDAGMLPALREYDLIRGLTGIGAYLLHRQYPPLGTSSGLASTGSGLLGEVLAYLIRLTQPVTVNDGAVLPGWWTGNAPNDEPSPNWPGGHGNLGLAHGIAGPLALLALTARCGIEVSGHADAIGRICAWLDQWRIGTGTQAWWPELISRREHTAGTTTQAGPGRPSWCYGTPGLARAQQLAGHALGDPQRQRDAELALAGCLADQRQLNQLTDTSLCHGWAGLLHTTWRVATDATYPDRFHLPQLLARTQQYLHHQARPTEQGLLTGAAGTTLALHTATLGTPPLSGWDACLLLDAGRPDHKPRANNQIATHHPLPSHQTMPGRTS